MESLRSMTELVQKVNSEWDTERALDFLSHVALRETSSRNVMFARMNDEFGVLELTNGDGSEWTPQHGEKKIRVAIGPGGGIVGYVAAAGSRFVSGDVQQEPLYENLFRTSKSEVAVPIRDRIGRIRAVLNAESDVPNRYTEVEIQRLEVIGGLAGIVISRDELLRREEALFEVGRAVDQAQSESELLNRMLRIANDFLFFQSCAIFLWDEAAQQFRLRAATGTLADKVDSVGYQPGLGLTGWVAQNATPLRLEDPQRDARWRGHLLEIPAHEISGYLAVPIIHRGAGIGAIRVIRRVSENPHHDNRFTEDDERVLSAIAEQVATGIETIRTLQRIVRVERMAAWGELSAKSSHMIGNRVFALRGDVNELGHLLGEPSLQREALQELQQSLATNVTRVEEILQEFRDFVSATQLTKSKADLNTVVQESVDEVFPRRSGIRLEYDLAPDLPAVDLDTRKFRRALTEIVENSLSFFQTGRLRVSTRRASPDEVNASGLNSEQGHVLVEIEDQGPGVEADRKKIIFQPFHSSRVKGMGLGLSIVKGIVEAHGGTVLEVGTPGEGARFVMLVPIAERPDP